MQSYKQKLEELRENSSYRTIKNIQEKDGKYIIVDDKKMLNLSSNDYLNLSTDNDLKLEFIEKYKNHPDFLFSSASARLLTGSSLIYKKLEYNFSKLFNKESALIFNTGYQANLGIVSTLAQRGDLILSDKLNHASVVAGLKLSSAEHFRYNHMDCEHLERFLKEKRNKYNNAIIISESVFSMDGDIADIKKLVELKKKYNCLLMIDEAHAFGVFGDKLQGVSAQLGLLDEIDIITITLGKALASSGAICVANKTIIDYLVNKASSFIFSTAIAPINVMWSNFLLEEKFNLLKEKKEKLNSLSKKVHKIYPSISQSQIIPVILGSAQNATNKALELQQKGFYVLPINPPTVPVGTSRLRISLTSDIKFEEICNIFG
ncbi:MAG: 8-amino-7-oxononanoate synthase [Candidatus Gastranaerophilales bacterium]|nr:8-amino-7-oxononanoate synthase [Candidatus Gastranaerophilales bacterium]